MINTANVWKRHFDVTYPLHIGLHFCLVPLSRITYPKIKEPLKDHFFLFYRLLQENREKKDKEVLKESQLCKYTWSKVSTSI